MEGVSSKLKVGSSSRCCFLFWKDEGLRGSVLCLYPKVSVELGPALQRSGPWYPPSIASLGGTLGKAPEAGWEWGCEDQGKDTPTSFLELPRFL